MGRSIYSFVGSEPKQKWDNLSIQITQAIDGVKVQGCKYGLGIAFEEQSYIFDSHKQLHDLRSKKGMA